MSVVAELVRALELQAVTMQEVEVQQLDRPSRCDGWTIREVLDHSLGVTRKFAEFAAGRTDEPHTPAGDLVVPNHKAAVTIVLDEARAAWSSADMSRTCRLPFGTFTADAAAGINLFDALAHTWDIADALAIDLDGDDELWVVGLAAAREVIGPSRDAEQYAPEIPIVAGAPAMHRLLAYLGRPVSDGA